MKKVFGGIAKFCISGMIAVAVLSLFCLFYEYDGAAVPDATGATFSKRLPNQLVGYMKEGYSLKRTDKNGYYNLPDADSDHPAILLMGDSQMEGKQLPTKNMVSSLLNQYYPTYNIAVSGHELCAQISNLSHALKAYSPSDYVIMQTGECHIPLQDIEQVLSGEKDVFYRNELLSRVIQYVPAVPVIYNQLELWWNSSRNAAAADEASDEGNPAEPLTDEYRQALEALLQKAANDMQESSAQLIIFRMHALTVDAQGAPVEDPEAEREAEALFEQLCEKYGILFVDMRDAFIAFYRENQILPRGFSNSIPGQGHLNQYGHQVIAESLLRTIHDRETGSSVDLRTE